MAAESEMVRVLLRFRAWVASGHCLIRTKTGRRLEPLVFNRLQRRIWDVQMEAARAGEPLRIIILKARQLGCSTYIKSFEQFVCSRYANTYSLTVTHSDDSARSMFEIVRRIKDNDPEHHRETPTNNVREVKYLHDDGDQKSTSKLRVSTAGGHFVGSSETIQVMHISEQPKWKGDESSIMDTLASLHNTVPDTAWSMVVNEATANMSDCTGFFEKSFRAALAGKSTYKALFVPWFWDDGYRVKGVTRADINNLRLPDDEQQYLDWLMDSMECDAEQAMWYHQILADPKCNGIDRIRKQEYPSTIDEAFQSAHGRVWPQLSKPRHGQVIEDLRGWELYRGIDWGGTKYHPFVCLWAAYMPDTGDHMGFSVDLGACPMSWKQFTGYRYFKQNDPAKEDDDACDALGYIYQTYIATHGGRGGGHLHVYRELFCDDTALRGWSEIHLAEDIKRMSRGENYLGTVAGRDRPLAVNLFEGRGIMCEAVQRPATTVSGERLDRIYGLEALINASKPFLDRLPVETPVERIERLERDAPFVFAHTSPELAVELQNRGRARETRRHPWLGGSW